MIVVVVIGALALFAFGCACFTAGEVYQLEKELRALRQAEIDDLNARDEWANKQEGAA